MFLSSRGHTYTSKVPTVSISLLTNILTPNQNDKAKVLLQY